MGLWCGLAIALLLVAYAGVIELSRPHVGGERLRYDQFVQLVQQERIRDARVLNQDAVVVGSYRRRDGTTGSYSATYLKTAGSQDMLVQTLVRKRVPTTIDQQFAKSLVLPATLLLPALILVVIFIYLIVSYRRGSGLFGIRSGARRLRSDGTAVTFADVAGQREAIAELRDLVEFLSEPERFAELGARIPKGILLYGPPGCGKTLLARALAGEAGASFYSISGSDFVELYVGVGAARVRDLFAEAREQAPAIVFVDELDSVGRRRGAGGAASTGEEQEQALNQFLAEMDGFSPSDGIIVLGATNRPDLLDPALLRPGRFDRSVGLERPDEEGRLEILRLHAASRRLAPGVDLERLARRAIGLTGADLANVVNEGALLAGRAGQRAIAQEHLEEGLRRILDAPERQRRLSMRDPSVGRRAAADGRVTFGDVAGVDDALEELRDVKDYLAQPERFAQMGARAPRGILLAGPPGCGKTLLARAVAGEANAAFFSVSGTDFVEVFVGQGAARVRDLFAEARAVAPSILFIDEIDAVGGRRADSAVDGTREREQTLNQILVEMDGFDTGTGVVVMAATNRIDVLDPALIRPGRFDRQVAVELPDREGRRAILAVHAAGKPLAADVDLDVLASVSPGFSGADLAAVLNEAALLAARRRLPGISMAVVEEAMERMMLGVSSRRHILTAQERRTVAYHESGHALVALALPGARLPHKLSVIPRGRALGFMWDADDGERAVQPRSDLLDQMAMLLGGRAAELLVFGEPSSGAAEDLRRVNAMARRMVGELGMSDRLGGMTYEGGEGRYADAELAAVGAEARRLVEEAEGIARDVLHRGRASLDLVAAALLEREVLSASELEAIVHPGGTRQAATPVAPGR